MIAIDTNLLVYAHRADSAFHDKARSLIEGLAEEGRAFAIPWACMHEFIGVVTHPRVFKHPTPLADALDAVRQLLELPSVRLLAEEPGYLDVLARCAVAARIAGPAIHDTRIAALCLFHGVRELWSADRDFSRYPSLVVRNPLV